MMKAHRACTVPKPDSSRASHLQALAAALAQLTPQRVPGFVFSWLELISHRHALASTP